VLLVCLIVAVLVGILAFGWRSRRRMRHCRPTAAQAGSTFRCANPATAPVQLSAALATTYLDVGGAAALIPIAAERDDEGAESDSTVYVNVKGVRIAVTLSGSDLHRLETLLAQLLTDWGLLDDAKRKLVQ
jgi:hypothetical protein